MIQTIKHGLLAVGFALLCWFAVETALVTTNATVCLALLFGSFLVLIGSVFHAYNTCDAIQDWASAFRLRNQSPEDKEFAKHALELVERRLEESKR